MADTSGPQSINKNSAAFVVFLNQKNPPKVNLSSFDNTDEDKAIAD